jgi:hypothetical protein
LYPTFANLLILNKPNTPKTWNLHLLNVLSWKAIPTAQNFEATSGPQTNKRCVVFMVEQLEVCVEGPVAV